MEEFSHGSRHLTIYADDTGCSKGGEKKLEEFQPSTFATNYQWILKKKCKIDTFGLKNLRENNLEWLF